MNQTLDKIVNSTKTKICTAILTGLIGYQTINTILPNNIAYAQSDARASTPERVSIEEYYNRAKQRDDLFPGARVGEYRLPVKGTHSAWIEGGWEKTYYDNTNGDGDRIRRVLASDGHARIIDFLKDKNGVYRSVAVFAEGYIQLASKYRDYKIIFRISANTAKNLSTIGPIQ